MQEFLKRFLTIIMAFICSNVQAQSFILRGHIKGKDTGTVTLSFRDIDNKLCYDKATLDHGIFKFVGTVGITDYAAIDTDTSYQIGDNKYARLLFIEPGEMTISFTYGDIGNAKISGSKTQSESDAWIKYNRILIDRANQIRFSADSIRAYLKMGLITPKAADDKTKELQQEYAYLKRLLLNSDISYITQHDSSYLSLKLLKYSIGQLPTDSIDLLYSTIASKVKNSSLGYGFIEYYSVYKKAIGQEYPFNKIIPGEMAPNFTIYSRSSDTSLNLQSFKGTVLLLEFWGLDCLPCLKLNPLIESIRQRNYQQLKVIAVNCGPTLDLPKVTEYINKNRLLEWYHVFESSESWATNSNIKQGMFEGYHALEVPRTVVIDRDGRVIYKSSGFSWEQVNELKSVIYKAANIK